MLYAILIIGFIFSLVAVFKHANEEYLKNFSLTVSVFSILFCIVLLNRSNEHGGTIDVFAVVSMAAYLIYLFSQTDIRWKD